MFDLRAGFNMRKLVVASRSARLGFACISADIPLIFATGIKAVVVASSVVFFIAGTACSQICGSIILHGLRNVSVSQSNESSVALEYFNRCEINANLYTDSQLAAAAVEIFGSGSGGQIIPGPNAKNVSITGARRTKMLPIREVEAQALQRRLDLQIARIELEALAKSLGLTEATRHSEPAQELLLRRSLMT
jgi:hypothetical protein